MTAFVALHVLLILFVPWRTRWVPASACAAIGAVDLYRMLAILFVVGKPLKKPNAGIAAKVRETLNSVHSCRSTYCKR